MRYIPRMQEIKRGCKYCADMIAENGRRHCKFEYCPYFELDKHDIYDDYLKKTMPKISLRKLLGK